MLFDRQKQLLALAHAFGGEIGGMDFQKLLLLYCHAAREESPYEFVPYKYGGFSFTSYADKRRLIERGLLADEDRVWKLTAEGQTAAVAVASRYKVDRFADDCAGLRGDDLVAETYRRYPYYAIRSEIAEKVLADDAVALKAIADARPSMSQSGLCTIGYEGRTLEGYLNVLLRSGVTVLCDVRKNPLSRKYGFSKNTLLRSCEGVGIRYEHLPVLGIAADERRDLKTQSDYDELFELYARTSLPKNEASLRKIGGWISEGERVALTCYERLPEQCHRHCVADALERMFGKEYTPVHL